MKMQQVDQFQTDTISLMDKQIRFPQTDTVRYFL